MSKNNKKPFHIARPSDDSGKRIQHPEANVDILDSIKYPLFCFNKIHKDWGISKCTKNEKAHLSDTLFKLSQLDWHTIEYSGRHGKGTEKIKHSSLKVTLPPGVTEDVTLLALRFGELKAMVGYRNRCIFHVLYLDRTFQVYGH